MLSDIRLYQFSKRPRTKKRLREWAGRRRKSCFDRHPFGGKIGDLHRKNDGCGAVIWGICAWSGANVFKKMSLRWGWKVHQAADLEGKGGDVADGAYPEGAASRSFRRAP